MRPLLALGALLLGAASPDPGRGPLELALKPDPLDDPARVPMVLEVRLEDGRPQPALVASQKALVALLEDAGLREEKGQLLVPRADARPLKLKPRKPQVVEFESLGRSVPVLFYAKQERWYAAPAARLRGAAKSDVLELLDADLDGRWDETLDFVAWRGGAFRVLEKEPLLHDDDGLRTLRLEEGKRGELVARLELEPLPEGLGGAEVECWRAVNVLRNRSALGPVRLSPERIDAAHKHARYLQLNGPGGSGTIDVHDEDPALPGYTKEGHRAAGGNVGWGSGGRDLSQQPIYEFATLFHRGEFLSPSPDMGCGAAGGYSVVWVEQQHDDLGNWLARTGQGSHWVMVPAPGQREVPTYALRDSPTPASAPDFYTRSRSWPVSVSTSYAVRDFASASLRVFDAKGKEVDGFLFTLADAGFGGAGFPADWIWAGKAPFERDVEYRAEFRATLQPGAAPGRDARELAFDWTFSTGG